MSRSERSRPWKTIRSVTADDTSVLGTLVRQAHELRRCEDSLKGYLHLSGAESLRVAAIERGAIVAVADSAARCARLRFLAPRIVAHAASVLGRPDLDRLEVRVRPVPVEKPERPRPAHTAPSSVARELLRSAAEAIDNRRLRETLLRMSGARPAESPQNDGPARRPGARLDLTRAEGMPPVTAATGGRGAGPASG